MVKDDDTAEVIFIRPLFDEIKDRLTPPGPLPTLGDRHIAQVKVNRARQKLIGQLIMCYAVFEITKATTRVIRDSWKWAVTTPDVGSSVLHKFANIIANKGSGTTLSERMITHRMLKEFNKFLIGETVPKGENPTAAEPTAWDVNPLLRAIGSPLTPAETQRIVDATTAPDCVKRNSFVYRIAMECKEKFHTPRRTLANRTAVYEYAVRAMKAHGHRPTAVVRDAPIVLLLVFTPTDSDLSLAKIGNTYSIVDRVVDYWKTVVSGFKTN